MSKKTKAANGMIDMINLLEKLRIFTEDDWRENSNALSEKLKTINPTLVLDLLRQARERYCSFTLYQSFIHYCDCNNSGIIESRNIKRICDNEGFNIVTFAKMIGTWMWDYSITGIRTSKNALYIVGDSNSAAEMICHSIINLFKCVHTADINSFNALEIAEIYKEVKLIYFPSTYNTLPFTNALANNMIRGRDTHLVTKNGPVTIPPIKCLIHLNSMPNLMRMPTKTEQHFIIPFHLFFEARALYHHELRSIIQAVSLAVDELDMDCDNGYGVLCANSDPSLRCHACSRYYEGRINHPSVE